MNHRITKLVSAFLFLAAIGCTAGPADTPSGSEALAASIAVGGASCPHAGQIAVAEECNAFDDDCDGRMDEGACDDPCNAFDEPVRATRPRR